MSTLIVQLPPRDPAVPSQEWRLPDLPFLLLDKRGRTMRAGKAALAHLPHAGTTVLLVAARDLLMVSAKVPPLKGPRLRQILPNVIEEQLIQDPQTCHVALDPAPAAAGRRMLAVVDRGWFRFLYDTFTDAGHRGLRAVPLARCLPAPAEVPREPELLPDAAAAPPATAPANAAAALAAVPVVVLLLGTVVPTDPGLSLDQPLDAAAPRVELALVRGAHAEGLAVPVEAVAPTLEALVGTAPLTLLRLTDVPGETSGAAPAYAVLAGRLQAEPLPFETLARNALGCRFDLCQFEFSAQFLKFGRDTLRRWRLPIGLAALCLLVAIVGENIQWLTLAHQRDALNGQMTELLLSTFPKTTVVLDAPTQMSHQLEQLRTAAGELSPDDFLSLAVGLAASLGPVPGSALAALDYQQRALAVTFKPGVQVDDGLARRLARNGLEGKYQQGKWIIRSSR